MRSVKIGQQVVGDEGEKREREIDKMSRDQRVSKMDFFTAGFSFQKKYPSFKIFVNIIIKQHHRDDND